MVKAQVLAGGRGKGKFDSGLEGGVQIVFTSVHDSKQIYELVLKARRGSRQGQENDWAQIDNEANGGRRTPLSGCPCLETSFHSARVLLQHNHGSNHKCIYSKFDKLSNPIIIITFRALSS